MCLFIITALSSTIKPVSLAGCSRLLHELEQQRSNVETIAAVQAVVQQCERNTKMETDELTDKIGSLDSGIENMETDEGHNQLAVAKFNDDPNKSDEIEICLSRILNGFWAEHCEGHIIVSEYATVYKEEIASANVSDDKLWFYEDLTSQIIVEIAQQYYDGKRIDYKNSEQDQSMASTPKRRSLKDDITDTNSSGTNDCATPMLAPFNPADQGIFKYLIGCHDRCNIELSNYNEARKLKEFGQPIIDAINMAKQQIIAYSVTLPMIQSSNYIKVSPNERSPLLDLLYEDEIPSDYLNSLISEAYRQPEYFAKIFGLLINNLFSDMQAKIVGPINLTQIIVLDELFNVTVIGEPSIRPICNLVAKLFYFYPTMFTNLQGREITKTSFLGPFLSISVFSEENVKLLSTDDKNHGQTDRLQMVNKTHTIFNILKYLF